MTDLHIKTPLIASENFKKCTGKVFLKLESLQPTGSFKLRGISLLCQTAHQQGTTHFISSSGGNAGLAAAYCGRKLKVKTTVVVPTTTSVWAQEKIIEQGAHLKIHGDNWSKADELARDLAQQKDTSYIHPFDHPLIHQGNSSIIHELKDQMPKPDAIVLSVGGGGLLCGVAEGLDQIGWHDVKIYTCEMEGAPSFRAAIEHGGPVDIGPVNTVAVTLAAPKVCAQAYSCSQTHNIVHNVVSDESALLSTIDFANNHRMLVEPSCGASLSVLDANKSVQREKTIALIVCGGAGVTLDIIEGYKKIVAKDSAAKKE